MKAIRPKHRKRERCMNEEGNIVVSYALMETFRKLCDCFVKYVLRPPRNISMQIERPLMWFMFLFHFRADTFSAQMLTAVLIYYHKDILVFFLSYSCLLLPGAGASAPVPGRQLDIRLNFHSVIFSIGYGFRSNWRLILK